MLFVDLKRDPLAVFFYSLLLRQCAGLVDAFSHRQCWSLSILST